MNNFVVYKHTSPSGKVYVGITSRKPEERWENGYGYKGQVFYNAIEKYGWENISHEILFENLSEKEAKLLEKLYIFLYDSKNSKYGYNVHFGGGECPIKTKKVICIKPKLKTTEEFESILEASLKTGCHPSNISNCCRNRQNMTISNSKEILIWMYYEDYIKLDKEQIEIIVEEKTKNKNLYVCLNTKEIFFTATDAAKKYNTSHQQIGKVCLNKAKTSGKDMNGNKLVWAYYKDYIKMTDEEVKEKIEKAYKRNLPYITDEKKIQRNRKISMKHKGKKCSLSKKERLHEIMAEKWENDKEYIQKMKERNLKNSGSNNLKARKIICINTGEIFNCIKEAKDKYNVSHISACCRGERNKAGKHPTTGEFLKWMYYEDYIKEHNNKEIS